MNYKQLLQTHQLKATPQRLAIMEHMGSRGHISIDELYTTIRAHFSTLSLATLYKNIHAMIGVNLVREVKLLGQKARYEIEKEPHAHVICKQCGELKDIHFDPTSLFDDALQASQYETHEVSVVISGLCPSCQKN
jgi:Fe2+ or Zn2+ uptake regulation protein